jgi:hypothetical protein
MKHDKQINTQRDTLNVMVVTITLTLDMGLQAHDHVAKPPARPLEPSEGAVLVTDGRL